MSKIFKVVKILDDYKLAINAGAKDQISLGQKFLIYSLAMRKLLIQILINL